MLSENPAKRPDIYRVMKEVCSMRGKEVPVKDIYTQRTQSETRSNQRLPSPEPNVKTPPPVAAVQEIPTRKEQQLPDITPMRRGRPPTTQRTPAAVPATTTTPAVKQDPFAALDAADIKVRAAAVDKLASKFPAVDELSTPTRSNTAATKVLADKTFEALSQSNQSNRLSTSKSAPAIAPQKPAKKFTPIEKPLPKPPSKPEVSSPSSPLPPTLEIKKPPPVSNRPIWKVPELNSQRPSFSESATPTGNGGKLETLVSRTAAKHNLKATSLSSRPSLESMRTESFEHGLGIERSQSADIRPSVIKDDAAASEEDNGGGREDMSTIDYLRETEKEKHHIHLPHRSHHDHQHLSLRRAKHASMPASALSGSRPIASNKLGAAFRRFEAGEQVQGLEDDDIPALSPMVDINNEDPITFPETAVEEDEEDLSPGTRREIERHHASAEERRVAEAAAAYRQDRTRNNGMSRQGPGTVRKVSAIQDRVNNFLAESGKAQPTRRTAEGYGRFTTTGEGQPEGTLDGREVSTPSHTRRASFGSGDDRARVQPQKDVSTKPLQTSRAPATLMSGALNSTASGTSERLPAVVSTRTGARPSAPPKKAHLRTATGSSIPPPRLPISASAPAPLVEEDLMEFTVVPDVDDPEADFAKRYPDVELIEQELVGSRANRPLRVRDV